MKAEKFIHAILLILTMMITSGGIYAQDLSSHLWKDRIVVIYTIDSTSKEYTRQLSELRNDIEGLVDRKLRLYSVTPTHFKMGWEDNAWKKRNNSLEEILNTNKEFEVMLLGLDGRVKLRQDHLLSNKKLFATIDSMPMRQSELRNRDK